MPLSDQPPSPQLDRIVGFIDLGTNSVRLLLAHILPDHSFQILSQQKEVARLGEGEFEDHRLKPAAMDRAIRICTRFVEMARSQGATEIVAVATSACREARNQNEFLERMRREADLDLHVISGQEEARLIHLGVSSGINLGNQTALFMDIGGGSTEVILDGSARKTPGSIYSLKLGAIRLTMQHLPPADPGPIAARAYRAICREVRSKSLHAVQSLSRRRIDMLVGSSGTLQNLCDATSMRLSGRPLGRDEELRRQDVIDTIYFLGSLPLEERRRVPGINPDRADIIIAGAAIFDVITAQLKIERVRTSDRGLREGLLIDYLQRILPAGSHAPGSFREQSVIRLARLCRFDESHARHVAMLSLMLYDALKRLRLHDLGPGERELLEYSALMHDIGTFIAYTNHPLHSHYFIRNAELLGFDQNEIAIMALTARYHQKSYPSLRNPEFAALSEPNRRVVCILATIVRLAECLDRSHRSAITAVDLSKDKSSREGCKSVTLSITTTEGEPSLELWGVESRRKAFKRTFGQRLRVAHAMPVADAVNGPRRASSA